MPEYRLDYKVIASGTLEISAVNLDDAYELFGMFGKKYLIDNAKTFDLEVPW